MSLYRDQLAGKFKITCIFEIL